MLYFERPVNGKDKFTFELCCNLSNRLFPDTLFARIFKGRFI